MLMVMMMVMMMFVLVGHEHGVVEALVAQLISRYDVLSSVVLSVLIEAFLDVGVAVIAMRMWLSVLNAHRVFDEQLAILHEIGPFHSVKVSGCCTFWLLVVGGPFYRVGAGVALVERDGWRRATI